MPRTPLGRFTEWLIRHRILVLLVWILPSPFFAYGCMNVSQKLLTIVMTSPEAQSTYVERVRAGRFEKQSQFIAFMTLHHDSLRFDEPAFQESARRLHAALRPMKCVKALISFEDLPVQDLFVSKDEHTQVSVMEMDVGLNDYPGAGRCVEAIRGTIRKLRADLPQKDLELLVSGPPAIDVDVGRLIKRDSRRAELIVALVSLILLVWMFRSASAAVLPLITAGLAVSSTLSVVFLVADHVELSMYVSVVASMTGLGLGLDYALLYVSRFREERDNGQEPHEAIITAAQTAGKAITGSGIIVMMGFAGLLIPQLRFPQSVGLAGILVVFFTLLVTLTLLPVLLSFWHPTMRWPRWRWFRASHTSVDRFWERWSGGVLKRPLKLLLLGLVVVGVLGPNLFRLQIKNPRHEAVPMELESRRGVERLIQVSGEAELYRIVVVATIGDGGDWNDPKRREHFLKVLEEVRSWPDVEEVRSADLMTRLFPLFGFGKGIADRYISIDRKLISMDIYGRDPSDSALNRLVGKLRRELPRQFASDPGIKTHVGDKQAMFYETKARIVEALPLMFPVLALAAFLFMAFFFRSVVVPAKALLLNALSLFTTFGILVLVFQNGFGISIIGHSGPPPGALSVATPIILFGVVFGVSMDYEVFLMTRIQEAYRRRVAGAVTAEEREKAHRDAIHEGLSRTGGIITNAALIMVITFAAFISGTVMPMKEMGFAMALAVALDATLVRMLLVPSVLRLIGRRTWYWPLDREKS